MSVLLEFSMYPVGKGESLSKYVARSLKIISESGVNYRLGPMSTALEGRLEGNWDEVMDVVQKCYEAMRKDCNRIACYILVDYRRGRTNGITGKIESVQKKLGRKLRT